MINLLKMLKLIYRTFFCCFLTVWTWMKKENLHLTFSLHFVFIDRYRDVSLYDCLAIYKLSQNRCIVILSLSWAMYHDYIISWGTLQFPPLIQIELTCLDLLNRAWKLFSEFLSHIWVIIIRLTYIVLFLSWKCLKKNKKKHKHDIIYTK